MQSMTAGKAAARARLHRPRAAATASSSLTPAVCTYPACTSRLRAISELQPWGHSSRKKQEVWDGPSRRAGSPKRQAQHSALPRPSPAPSLWQTSLGSVSGAGLSSKNPDVFVGHSRHTPRVPFAVASLGFLGGGVGGEVCSRPGRVVGLEGGGSSA